MRKIAMHVAVLGCLLGASAAGCEVPDPEPGAALYEKTSSLPALPTLDWTIGDADGIEQFQYDPQNNLWLNVYKARLPAGVSAPKGIAFYAHGGAFTFGERTGIHDVARYMWSQGWTLVSIDYRLSGRNWLGQPVNPFPAAIHDAKRALRWIKNRYDTESTGLPIVAVGHSAGGNLVTLMATSALQPGETPPPGQMNLDANPNDPLRHISATVDGALAIAGATDLEASLHTPLPPDLPDIVQPFLTNSLTDYFGCPVRGDVSTCDLAVVRAASANSYVTAGDAPIYAALHELDPGGPPTQGCRLGQQYAQAGQVVWYWMDIVLAPGPLASTLDPIATWFGPFEELVTGMIGLEHHFVLGLNTAAVDAWLGMIAAGNLPKTAPEGQQVTLVQRCLAN